MLTWTYALNFGLMLALPVGLGIWVTRRFHTPWSLWGWGALAFLASQAARLPLLWGLTALFQAGVLPAIPTAYTMAFNIGVLSLTAGIFEEGSRYVFYRWALPRTRHWKEAITFGAGHGGVEALLLGVAVAMSYINMVALRTMDLSTLGLSAAAQAKLAGDLAAYWSAPWYLTFLGGVERIFALTLHLSLAVLVLQVFVRRNLAWLAAAIGWHTLANIVGVTLAQQVGPLVAEGALAGVAVISVALILWLRPAQEVELPPEPIVQLPSTATPPAEPRPAASDVQLDDSRFTH